MEKTDRELMASIAFWQDQRWQSKSAEQRKWITERINKLRAERMELLAEQSREKSDGYKPIPPDAIVTVWKAHS